MASSLTEFVVSYGKLDDEPVELVEALIGSAREYLSSSGIKPGLETIGLYKLAVAGIVAHWHENRAAVDQTAPKDFEPGIRLIINQLKRENQIMDAVGGDAQCD